MSEKVRIFDKNVTAIRVSEIRVSKIRVSKIRVTEIRVSKIRVTKIRVSKIRVSEIRISSNHPELHGAIFINSAYFQFLISFQLCFAEYSGFVLQ